MEWRLEIRLGIATKHHYGLNSIGLHLISPHFSFISCVGSSSVEILPCPSVDLAPSEMRFSSSPAAKPQAVTREAAPGLDPFVLMALGPALSVQP